MFWSVLKFLTWMDNLPGMFMVLSGCNSLSATCAHLTLNTANSDICS